RERAGAGGVGEHEAGAEVERGARPALEVARRFGLTGGRWLGLHRRVGPGVESRRQNGKAGRAAGARCAWAAPAIEGADDAEGIPVDDVRVGHGGLDALVAEQGLDEVGVLDLDEAAFEGGPLDVEDAEEERAERLGLGRGRRVALDRAVVEGSGDLRRTKLPGVAVSVSTDEVADSVEVGLLGSRGVVKAAKGGTNSFDAGQDRVVARVGAGRSAAAYWKPSFATGGDEPARASP
ncbi:MAG: hypothetical protein K1X67_15080, partial [Fimbriimonadaceae bacterium]|nr:hypothetical protein [Fimbriimonadaceae bacterium]